MSKRTTGVNKEIAFMGIMVAIESLLAAYMSGGFTRLMLAAIIGILMFRIMAKSTMSLKSVIKDFGMLICVFILLVMTGKSGTWGGLIVLLGMPYAGIVTEYAIHH